MNSRTTVSREERIEVLRPDVGRELARMRTEELIGERSRCQDAVRRGAPGRLRSAVGRRLVAVGAGLLGLPAGRRARLERLIA